jgi:hypothetical protein
MEVDARDTDAVNASLRERVSDSDGSMGDR